MADQEKMPLPEDPPVTIREDEVERLLEQAQSLAGEIASTAGAEQRLADENHPSQSVDLISSTEAADALSTAEDVERTLSDLNQLLNSVQQEEDQKTTNSVAPRSLVPTPQPTSAVDEAESLALQQEIASMYGPVPEPDADEVTGESAWDVTTSPLASDPVIESAYDFDPQLLKDLNIDLGESGEVNQETPDILDGLLDTKPLTPRRSIKEILRHTSKSLLKVGKFAALAMPYTILFFLKIVDRPFAGLSPTAKNLIGFSGIATLILGIASWVLPGMLKSNPYEALPTNQAQIEQVAEPESSGHGGAAKSGHGQAPKSSHRE